MYLFDQKQIRPVNAQLKRDIGRDEKARKLKPKAVCAVVRGGDEAEVILSTQTPHSAKNGKQSGRDIGFSISIHSMSVM